MQLESNGPVSIYRLWNSKSLRDHTSEGELQDDILYVIYYGPYGLKTNEFSVLGVHEDHNAEKVMNVDPREM